MTDVAPIRETKPAKAVVPPLLAPGQVVGGYEVSELIGKGGMGEVYRARQLSMDREVALKILSPHLALKDPSFAKRFVDEARAAGKLNHPNVVHVHDVSTATLPDGGPVHFFSMEFIDGESVQDLLNREKRLSAAQIATIMPGVAEALSFAAKVGIVHRDIKPDNIMLTKAGLVKVADLGLAIASQTGDDHAPERDEKGRAKVMGTPLYLSPEQARALPVDFRSDQYSLGATLFHLLTGEPPFRAADAKGVMKAHVVEPVPDPVERFPEADEAWSQIAFRLMQKKPDERFTSPDDLIEAVEAATKGITLEQLARKKLGFQMPMWGWYAIGAAVLVIALWMLAGHGSAKAPADGTAAQPDQPTSVSKVPTPAVTPTVTPAKVDPLAGFDVAVADGRLHDAQALLTAANQADPATVAAGKRFDAARTAVRKQLGVRIADAKVGDLDGILAEGKPLVDEDQTWLKTTIDQRRSELTPRTVTDADRWKTLGDQLDKLRTALAFDAVRTMVTQAAPGFTGADAAGHLTALANLGDLALKGEGAVRAYISATQPHAAAHIGGKQVDILLNRLTRTEVFYLVQGDGEPGPEQKTARTQLDLPWVKLLDDALADQAVDKAPLVKATCLWMWNRPEAKAAFAAIPDSRMGKAIDELERNRK